MVHNHTTKLKTNQFKLLQSKVPPHFTRLLRFKTRLNKNENATKLFQVWADILKEKHMTYARTEKKLIPRILIATYMHAPLNVLCPMSPWELLFLFQYIFAG